jgi:hypothetical protein
MEIQMGDLLEFKTKYKPQEITITMEYKEQFHQQSFSEKMKNKCLDMICSIICFFLPEPDIDEMVQPDHNYSHEKNKVFGK